MCHYLPDITIPTVLTVVDSGEGSDRTANSHKMATKEPEQRNGHTEVDLELEPLTSPDGEEAEVKVERTRHLVYGIDDTPPIHIVLIAALQQGLLGLATQLAVALFVSDAVCATNDEVMKARILSSTLFMDGVTTIAMSMIGARLPIFQGASAMYVIPLLSLTSVSEQYCSGQEAKFVGNATMVANLTETNREKIFENLRSLQGTLMIAGIIHALFGITGLIGVLLRFIGPITIVSTMMLASVYLVGPVTNFAQVHWGVSFMTFAIAVILSLYLENWLMPIPVWTPSLGFRVIRYPLQKVFAILISIIIGWIISAILTQAGIFTDDPTSPAFNARTDARLGVISESKWFFFPYPGQYGMASFNISAFVSFLIATLLSVLDSVGDYYACARVCRVPPPPAHAVNRGIVVEGICSFLAGVIGCGHATSSYGGNIGAIGITKVASRRVFVFVGLMYIVFGVIGKFSAVFVSIPYPVLGGALLTMFSIFTGVILSNIQVINLSSTRNLTILGVSVLVGLMAPQWVRENPGVLTTGSEMGDKIIIMILGNPMAFGTIVACVLDNTVPGTDRDRGIEAWQVSQDEDAEIDETLYDYGAEVYRPFLPPFMKSWKIMNYIPFLPNATKAEKMEKKS